MRRALPRLRAVATLTIATAIFSACGDASSGGSNTGGAGAPGSGSQGGGATNGGGTGSADGGAIGPGGDAGARADAAANDAAGDAALPPPGEPASRWQSAALPPLDAATVDHVRKTYALGRSKNNRDDVVMKAGDSITASTSFFFDLGSGDYALGSTYASLGPMIEAIRKVSFADNSTPFDRQSIAAEAGLITRDAIARNLIAQEIAAIRPSWAIMMFGSDDLEDYDAKTFAGYYNTILDLYDQEGVVVAISTIPRRLEYLNGDSLVADYNATIKSIAAARHLPLIDLYAGLDPLPNYGISSDDVHPTVELFGDGGSDSCDFTPAGLKFGYNVRNLTALEMLDRFRALRP